MVNESTGDTGRKLRILVAILGSRMHYAVPIAYESAGTLTHFYTDFYRKQNASNNFLMNIERLSQIKLLQRVNTRQDSRIPVEKVDSFNYLGIAYGFYLRGSRSTSQRQNSYLKFGEKFASKVRDANWFDSNAIYGLNTASKEFFQKGQNNHVTCILEQVYAPLRIANQLNFEEYSLWPGWQHSPAFYNQQLIDREEAEFELADGILCGSQFVIDGISSIGAEARKCHLIPYTADINAFFPASKDPNSRKSSDTLNVLYIGQLDLRKGIQYLWGALEKLNPKRFMVKIIGKNNLSKKTYRRISEKHQVMDFVPRTDIPAYFRWADVFVLPSICEGSALVIYEALASGLPVITTPNSGSVVRDNVDGSIVPIRSSDAIAECLEQFAKDADLRCTMGQNARENALQSLSWQAYAERLVSQSELIVEYKLRKS